MSSPKESTSFAAVSPASLTVQPANDAAPPMPDGCGQSSPASSAPLSPSYVFIENVPGLRTSGLRNVLADLTAIGYDATWDVFSAGEAGAPHLRERLFTLAYAVRDRLEEGYDARGLLQPSNDNGSTGQLCAVSRQGEWTSSPPLGARAFRMDNGISSDIHRIKCLGNSVVPQQSALAWRTLYERIR